MPMPLVVSDVDGVLTDRWAVPDPRVIDRLAGLVRRGWSLGLVTGRSHDWLAREILRPLRERLPDGLHQHVAVACELGAVVSTAADGPAEIRGPAVPPAVRDGLRALAMEPGTAELLEWDATKACLACVEVRHDAARAAGPDAAARALREYERRAAAILDGTSCTARVTTFAVDVGPDGLSKHDGTRVVLAHTAARPSIALAIGDSESDVEMARELAASLDAPVVFAWVAPSAAPAVGPPIELLRTDAAYALGALEALDAFEARTRQG